MNLPDTLRFVVMPRLNISSYQCCTKLATRSTIRHSYINTPRPTPSFCPSQLRQFHVSITTKMPETLSKAELSSEKDPSVSKQYDSTTPVSEQFSDLYNIIDGLKISMLSTTRKSLGGLPVSRSMAVSKRVGPDILYLANKNSTKFSDLEDSRTVQVTFQNTSTQDWVSLAGEVVTISSDDPRVKQLYTPMISAWFGDAGDGVHDGTADDPRMTLIEVKTKYITYWKKEVSKLGFVKEVAQAAWQGDVAQTGSLRQLFEKDIEEERQKAKGTEGGNDNSTANVA